MTETSTDLVRQRFGHAGVGAPPPMRVVPDEPEPVRRRRWLRPFVALVVVVLIAAALLGGRAWGRSGQTHGWQLVHAVAAGTVLGAADVRRVTVGSAAATGALLGSRPAIGSVTVAALPAGAVLGAGELAPNGVVPRVGQSLVGVAAAAGLAPDGLAPGDKVSVVALPPATQPGATPTPAPASAAVLVAGVTVQRVTGAGSGGTVFTLVVPAGQAVAISALSAQGRVALVATGG